MNPHRSYRKALIGNACIMLATIFWGVNYAFTKALIPDWAGAQAIAGCRILGACLLFWLTSLFVHCEKLDRDSMIRSIWSGLSLFCCLYLFVLSLGYGSPIDISIIMTLQPVFVILIEIIFLKRRPSLLESAGLVVSLAGAILIVLAGHPDTHLASNPLLGDGLAIVSGIAFSAYLVILAKPTLKYRPVSLLRWVFLYASIPALFLLPDISAMPLLRAPALVPWLELLFIVVCPTYLSYLLNQPAMHDIGPVLAALYQYVVPVVAAVSAVLLGVGTLDWSQVLAMTIIVCGMIMTNLGKKREQHRKAA